jgi:transposase
MSGVIEAVDWNESAQELYARYRAERDVEARKRLGALWLVGRGESVTGAPQAIGVSRRTLTRWLGWYRRGGLAEVLSRVPGHGAVGAECRLSERQRELLVERASLGEFGTYEEARRWVEQEWGVRYRYKGMYALLARVGVRPKVPRPAAQKADPKAQESWKRGARRGAFGRGVGLGASGVALRGVAPGAEGPNEEGAGAQGREGGAAAAAEVRVKLPRLGRLAAYGGDPVGVVSRKDEERADPSRARRVGLGGCGVGSSAVPQGQDLGRASHRQGVLAVLQPRAQPGREDLRGGASSRGGEGLRGLGGQAPGSGKLPRRASGCSRAS